jgi:hypothetical protein
MRIAAGKAAPGATRCNYRHLFEEQSAFLYSLYFSNSLYSF